MILSLNPMFGIVTAYRSAILGVEWNLAVAGDLHGVGRWACSRSPSSISARPSGGSPTSPDGGRGRSEPRQPGHPTRIEASTDHHEPTHHRLRSTEQGLQTGREPGARGRAGGPPTLREAVSGGDAVRPGCPDGGPAAASRGRTTRSGRSKDVSFEVERGEVVGIIGRNGAGKSTLLKILSRIVEPTAGIARLRGRVASLLEVGTGFHPELTGRENIYLNGAILGMRKAEIDRKFDEIVAFAEIEEFLDTPVKRYSSGMYVRLAFAVAAHLEPEILIVDEVLAVGDFAFQKKCLGKMQDVASGDGRTILFVSHNMGALAQLCDRGILLEKGSVTAIGPIQDVIEDYLGSEPTTGARPRPTSPIDAGQALPVDLGGGPPRRRHARDRSSVATSRSTIRLEVRGPQARPGHVPRLHPVHPRRDPGPVLRLPRRRPVDHRAAGASGVHTFEIRIPARLLAPMTYMIGMSHTGSSADDRRNPYLDAQPRCCEFTLRDLSNSRQDRPGVLGLLLPWEHQPSGRPAWTAGRARVHREPAGSVGRDPRSRRVPRMDQIERSDVRRPGDWSSAT